MRVAVVSLVSDIVEVVEGVDDMVEVGDLLAEGSLDNVIVTLSVCVGGDRLADKSFDNVIVVLSETETDVDTE